MMFMLVQVLIINLQMHLFYILFTLKPVDICRQVFAFKNTLFNFDSNSHKADFIILLYTVYFCVAEYQAERLFQILKRNCLRKG